MALERLNTGVETTNNPENGPRYAQQRETAQEFLTPEAQKVMEESKKTQEEIVGKVTEDIDKYFSDVTILSNGRAKTSIVTLSNYFHNEINKISEKWRTDRLSVALRNDLDYELKLKEIKDNVDPLFGQPMAEIRELAEFTVKDIKETGGTNSMEILLKTEKEIGLMMDVFKKDSVFKEALTWVLGFPLTDEQVYAKKDKVFDSMADKLINNPEESKYTYFIIHKMTLKERKEFRDKYRVNLEPLLIQRIRENKDNYSSMIYIDLFGEESFAQIENLDNKIKDSGIMQSVGTRDFLVQTENASRVSIGAENVMVKMDQGDIVGFIAGLWGSATAAGNLLVEFSGGRYKDPVKAVGSALTNPFLMGGAGLAYVGINGVDETMGDLTPSDELRRAEFLKAQDNMKNRSLDSRSKYSALIFKEPAGMFALGDFGKAILQLADNKLEDIDKNLLTKSKLIEHLESQIYNTSDISPDKVQLIKFKEKVEKMDIDDSKLQKLIIDILYLDLTGKDIEESEKNLKDLIDKL